MLLTIAIYRLSVGYKKGSKMSFKNKQSLRNELNKTYLIKTLLAKNLLFNPQ